MFHQIPFNEKLKIKKKTTTLEITHFKYTQLQINIFDEWTKLCLLVGNILYKPSHYSFFL